MLAKYNDIANKVGATSVAFEIEIFSTLRSVLGRESTASMIIDIGAANTKMIIVEEGIESMSLNPDSIIKTTIAVAKVEAGLKKKRKISK